MESTSFLLLILLHSVIPINGDNENPTSNELTVPEVNQDGNKIIEDKGLRDAKFSIFQIIKFSNDPCIGSSRNGTCFTKQECENEGGTDGGSCADGFGVCCILILTNGGSTSLNQSYIVQAASTSLGVGSREYTICPCSSTICRIKFDFTNFNLAAPATANAGVAATSATSMAVGDCQIDTFSITSPAYAGSPVICGTNENQHMIMDSDGTSCSKVHIGLGNGAATTSRQWDIMVTQYRCGEEDGGPPGCLQWHLAASGSIRSFNFPNQTPGSTVGADVVHLSGQEYEICIRTPAGSNHICYVPCTESGGTTAAAQIAFGLSIGPDAGAAQSGVDVSECSEDYIRILGGTTIANAQAGIDVASALFCGRAFETATATAQIDDVSVCSSVQPFKVGVHFSNDEYASANLNMFALAKVDTMYNDGEFLKAPGGIIGFSLCYTTGAPTAG